MNKYQKLQQNVPAMYCLSYNSHLFAWNESVISQRKHLNWHKNDSEGVNGWHDNDDIRRESIRAIRRVRVGPTPQLTLQYKPQDVISIPQTNSTQDSEEPQPPPLFLL